MKPIRFIFFIVSITFWLSCDNIASSKNVSEVSVSNIFLERVEPTNWWIDFKDTSLQLLVKEKNIGSAIPNISYAGVSIKKVHKAKSPNYLFIDLNIDKYTKPGKFDIVFTFDDETKKAHTYELKERLKPADDYIGFNSSDAIYLITPDRFPMLMNLMILTKN